MQTEIIYGFGFEVTDIEEGTLFDFIKNHKTAALKTNCLIQMMTQFIPKHDVK